MAATSIDQPTPGTDQPGSQDRAPTASAERLYWRAVVRTGGQAGPTRDKEQRLEWHLAACAAPRGEGSHCTEGQHLIETIGHPNGHCIVDGVCGSCGAASRAGTTG